MLTADLVRPRLRLRGSELSIEMLAEHDPFWLQTAADLIALLRGQADQSQEAWERALEAYEGERIDYLVVRGLAKVLTDAATFTPLATSLPPAQLRERLCSSRIDRQRIYLAMSDRSGHRRACLPAITWNWHAGCCIGRRISQLRRQVTTRISGGTSNCSNSCFGLSRSKEVDTASTLMVPSPPLCLRRFGMAGKWLRFFLR